jgi:hypothetical protein
LIDHELPHPGSAAGYKPSAHVLPLTLMLAGGGRTLEDLRVLRNDEGLRALVQLGDMPSSDATGDWLRRMGAQESGAQALGANESESNGSAGLGCVNRSVFRRLLRQDDHTSYTLDIDATQIVAENRHADHERRQHSRARNAAMAPEHAAETARRNRHHRRRQGGAGARRAELNGLKMNLQPKSRPSLKIPSRTLGANSELPHRRPWCKLDNSFKRGRKKLDWLVKFTSGARPSIVRIFSRP